MDADIAAVPIYLETDVEKLGNGLYLCLFHGRNTPTEELEDWGFGGPMIGPLKYVHTTYAHHVKFEFFTVEDHDRYFDRKETGWTMNDMLQRVPTFESSGWFMLHGDMIEYQGKFYGDWTVFQVSHKNDDVPFAARLNDMAGCNIGGRLRLIREKVKEAARITMRSQALWEIDELLAFVDPDNQSHKG